ncbi:LPXTG cell wall anchor domain-containing protein [Bifidobacterium pullorum subsp. saeculare]|uniref:LPXTG cell wall anchor domain-containing protein n=1 Tax=Bifidobacterium pullorum subsp. saeculare TaxID=78257 RepID=A0A939B9J0_9BIFI|nr:LPXTG cell wall anchor domain-containing protein [Bifidobacterium pullorum subsp. saeculare]
MARTGADTTVIVATVITLAMASGACWVIRRRQQTD